MMQTIATQTTASGNLSLQFATFYTAEILVVFFTTKQCQVIACNICVCELAGSESPRKYFSRLSAILSVLNFGVNADHL